MEEYRRTGEIACSLTSAALRNRRSMARESLLPHLIDAMRTESGLQLTFPDAAFRSSIETFVALERQCCGFLGFELAQAGDGLVLTIEGPAEAQPVIDMFADLLAHDCHAA